MVIRERRMWTQSRLAAEAGVSPTTVSGIESGRISRPHFGTVRKLARALGVEPEALEAELASEDFSERPLSLRWAMSSDEEAFERGLDRASMQRLTNLARELGEEQGRLRRLYGDVRSEEQRRLVKGLIRQVAANSGSVDASISAYGDREGHPSRDRGSSPPERSETQEPGA